MAKTTLTAQLASANARIAELEASLQRGRDAYRALLHTRREPQHPAAPQPVITHYVDRAGNTWEKTRTGNQATSRMVQHA